MALRVKFTKPHLDKLLKKKPKEQVTIWDEKQAGLCILHSPGPAHRSESTVTWRACFYTKDRPGIPKYMKIGRYGKGEKFKYTDITGRTVICDCDNLDDVRERCNHIRLAAKAGDDPKQPSLGDTIGEVVERYLASPDVKKQKTLYETKRVFNVYILPKWKNRKPEELQRSDVAALLDMIASNGLEYKSKRRGFKAITIGTPGMAASVYAQLVSLFNWYAARSNTFNPPIVKAMIGKTWNDKPRDRKLNDREIRALWQATADLGVYGACVRTALLSAQRFHKVSSMRRSDIKNGVWDARKKDDPEKKQVSEVALTPFALEIINSVPTIDAGRHSTDCVFSLNGKRPFNGWPRAKEILDKKMAEILGREIEPWQHRDLRRTARSLMARAGVIQEVGEVCLAHSIKGIEGVYNRHDYAAEKREAFQKLSDLIESIVAEETAAPKKLERVRLSKREDA